MFFGKRVGNAIHLVRVGHAGSWCRLELQKGVSRVLGKECLLLLPEIAFDEVLYYTML
jgi:hypothetical protein